MEIWVFEWWQSSYFKAFKIALSFSKEQRLMLRNKELEAIYNCLTGVDQSEKIDPLTNRYVPAKSFAVSMLYKYFWPIVFKRLRYRFNQLSEDETQDIVQEAFLKIYITSSPPKSFEALPSWVCKLVENNAIDLLRKAYVKNELDEYGGSREHFDGDGDGDGDVQASRVLGMSEADFKSNVSIDRVGVIRDFNDQINRDVESCMTIKMKAFGVDYPDRYLALSMLMDGNPASDIALVLERSVNATWVYIHESKKKLSPYIKNCLEMLN